ncbi:MAG: PQQ-dependent sugar dehydrogenase, partial [Anaerolineales bacterium]|nr:PQQ-dependent sugar dehydrogenase [Anaerolineales bacterium]
MKRYLTPIMTVLLLAVAAVLAASAAYSAASTTTPLTTPDVSIEPVTAHVFAGGITDIADAGDDRLFATEKTGRIQIIHPDGSVTEFLDISDRISYFGFQQGLLGLVFHANYAGNGYFYVHYTNSAGDSQISRFSVTADPDVADPNSEVSLFTIPQNWIENYGGDMAYGPDGYLYLAVGDGKVDSYPPYENNNAQDLTTLAGKILRIDVSNEAVPYTIPPDNPFVGVPDAQDAIWSYGLRNPWRFSFDRLTGEMFLSDVGQDEWEEVNLQPADSTGGENYGWPCFEGNEVHPYPPTGACDPLPTAVAPIFAYGHGATCAITGGFMYRGSQYPVLQGHYLYADSCAGKIWSLSSDGMGGWTQTLLVDSISSPSTFGEDEDGELYVASLFGGTLYRIVENTPPTATPTASNTPTPSST